jgi:hypothetical protein
VRLLYRTWCGWSTYLRNVASFPLPNSTLVVELLFTFRREEGWSQAFLPVCVEVGALAGSGRRIVFTVHVEEYARGSQKVTGILRHPTVRAAWTESCCASFAEEAERRNSRSHRTLRISLFIASRGHVSNHLGHNRSLPPGLPTVAGSMEQVCVRAVEGG